MFTAARLKLTAWYLLIIMFISLSFSFVIYKVLTLEVQRFARAQQFRIEYYMHNNDFPAPGQLPEIPATSIMADPDLINEVKRRLLLMLAEINLTIFVFSGVLGYLLAGRTLKPIAAMVEDQNRFISDASHEFRTPLTVLKTSMEVNLRDKNLDLPNARKIIADSIHQVNKLQLLSDNLLQLAQHQQLNGCKHFRPFSVKKIINDAVNKIRPLAQKKQITIKKSLAEYRIKGEGECLTNLIVILLDNAIKYSPNKSTVLVTSVKMGKEAIIKIKDHGVGIDKKDLPRIFDRFYRADQARSKTGYGLGLSIAKKIVNDHSGTIEVKSELKKGTLFIIRLPVFIS